MSQEKTKVVYKGLGLPHILTIIFVIAKILDYINWSWWLVLLPSLISIGLWLAIWLIGVIAIIVIAILDLKGY
jgi:hypothetical protein